MKICRDLLPNLRRLVMMWTYFPSVLLQGYRPPLCVFHLKRIKVLLFSWFHQVRLQEEQTSHTYCHAHQDPKPFYSGFGGLGGITSESLHLGGGELGILQKSLGVLEDESKVKLTGGKIPPNRKLVALKKIPNNF